ncbi:ATP synthase peripheral stalk subunit d, mitochondrial-like [Dermatophagoides pteronyssinus]|uniref:ATP synthase subunit d, mitochondrial n=2 Tax=Dermatophagoides pteronyssinus TaxID=6956 RepID=A0A6P6XS36_DERPT|nr:ATP synthase subunit d, mitochondrial-like [Dermatophagoides pteronyssinus]KAH9413613.1 Atp5hp [Dermatophagoides pteronyssinus]
MAANRISKSSIDWAKFASAVPKNEMKNFNAFKARSDAYLVRAMAYPENPPEINFNEYKARLSNKDLVQKLEQAYKSLKIPYPKNTVAAEIDQQELEYKKTCDAYVSIANSKIAEAEKLRKKFEMMLPVRDMNNEDFTLTFPDWVCTLESPSIYPHFEKTPGLSKEERERLAAPDGKPYSTV